MATRTQVNVFDASGAKKGTAALPAVFGVLNRPDVVETVAQRANMITRKAYAVSEFAGYQTAAESWGTGRAVARVPRVPGGGSHRSGQAAFANFCRGGGMFAPTRTYRKWTRQTNLTERRHAQAFAVSASGCTSLVIARGHKIDEVQEIPCVIDNSLESVTKTADAVKALKAIGAAADLQRCVDNRKIRAGKGKNRNRKYKVPVGPLVVYASSQTIPKCTRAIKGVDCAQVNNLSIRQLAPGGKSGRFIVYTEAAFAELDNVFGNAEGVSATKKGYKLPKACISGSVNKVLQSDQVLSVVRAKIQK